MNRLLQERRYFFAFFRRAKASAKRERTRRVHVSHGSHMVVHVPGRISGHRFSCRLVINVESTPCHNNRYMFSIFRVCRKANKICQQNNKK